MRWMESLFLDHPRSVGETYWQHFRCAATISLKLGCACLCQLLHAVIPGIHPPGGTDLRSLVEFCDKRLSGRGKENDGRE